jgi:hypothetical protein
MNRENSRTIFGLPAPILDKRHRLNPNHIEALSAPHILAPHRLIPPNHVALGLGKSSPVAVIGSSRQLRFLSPHHPFNLVLGLLSAMGTSHQMVLFLCLLIKKIAFFHPAPHHGRRPDPAAAPYAILPDMPPRKQE